MVKGSDRKFIGTYKGSAVTLDRSDFETIVDRIGRGKSRASLRAEGLKFSNAAFAVIKKLDRETQPEKIFEVQTGLYDYPPTYQSLYYHDKMADQYRAIAYLQDGRQLGLTFNHPRGDKLTNNECRDEFDQILEKIMLTKYPIPLIKPDGTRLKDDAGQDVQIIPTEQSDDWMDGVNVTNIARFLSARP